jgi:hypothetical protein
MLKVVRRGVKIIPVNSLLFVGTGNQQNSPRELSCPIN